MSLATKENRCEALAVSVIGMRLKIRFEKNASVTGEIVACTFIGWAERNTTKIARWSMVIKSGEHMHTFIVRKLPKAGTKNLVEIQPEGFKGDGFGNWCGVSA